MGNEYLPLVSSDATSEENNDHNKHQVATYALELREKLLVLVILLQTVAIVTSVLTRARGVIVACQRPYIDRLLLYCKCCGGRQR